MFVICTQAKVLPKVASESNTIYMGIVLIFATDNYVYCLMPKFLGAERGLKSFNTPIVITQFKWIENFKFWFS